MFFVKFWRELSASAKMGFLLGVVAIVALIGLTVYWFLPAGYQTVIQSNSASKIAVAVREIEKLKIPYQVTGDGTSIEVPADQAGRVKVGLADAGGLSSGVGFELFNNTDFSTTEFTQKINYQRALQGELARTVSTIEGVASARVHLVMPESGFLRRQVVKPTAAVHVMMLDGMQLSMHQVQGIQRLVAASVPDIKLDDIAVIDQEGIALTKTQTGATAGNASKGGLELKREVDAYLEGKLRKLLADVDPAGDFSVSVDTTLNLSDIKVVTEDVLPGESQQAPKATGVLVRERTQQRQDGVATVNPASGAGASAPQSASTSRELEYKVGRRVEEVVTSPGGIERVSVAVVARSSATDMQSQAIKGLISNAIGANEERGDSVAVVILAKLPDSESTLDFSPSGSSGHAVHAPVNATLKNESSPHVQGDGNTKLIQALLWLLGLAALLALALLYLKRQAQPAEPKPEALSSAELDAMAEKIKHWLTTGEGAHGNV